jgi:uncharacterized protein (TIGR03435 family)
MTPHDPDLEALVDTHLGLFASLPEEEMAAARQRTAHQLRKRRLETTTFAAAFPPPGRILSNWRAAAALIAAAALFLAVVRLPVPAQRSERNGPTVATVAEGDAFIDNASGARLVAGAPIGPGELLRTNQEAGAEVLLADGSRVEIRSRSALALERAGDGITIALQQGGIIVNAAKQRDGHLYVRTRDVTVSVVGTVFLVNAEPDGSRVGVIEGEVHVREQTRETRLRPGEQVSTGRVTATVPLKDEIAWSRRAAGHRAILAAFETGMAATAGPLIPLHETAAQQPGSGQGAPAAAAEFEEASVRLCDPAALPATPAGARGGGSGSLQMTPGRTHALCMTVAALVRTAYGFAARDYADVPRLDFNNVYGLGNDGGQRVRGGPDWVRTDRYTIDAVANESATARTMSGPMLRALLERRFQLHAHVEAEPAPAFALTIAEGGLKMKPVDMDACTRPPVIGAGAPLSPSPPIDSVRRGEKPACGLSIKGNDSTIALVGGATGLPPMGLLGEILGARVIDRTDIPSTARFNYLVEFAPDERTAGPLGGRGRAGVQQPDSPRASDIFTAFKEELGLQLEAVQAPREYIVIDRIERPSVN